MKNGLIRQPHRMKKMQSVEARPFSFLKSFSPPWTAPDRCCSIIKDDYVDPASARQAKAGNH